MGKEGLSNSHDRFFKQSFSRKEIVQSFLEQYLPADLTKRFDYTTLEILKDSFVDRELSEHFSDILYRIKVSGSTAFVYLLFEHKSYPDRWYSFQMLRNRVKIWEMYLKQNAKARKLPVIVPVVIYHGAGKWKMKNSIRPLFEEIPGAEKYIPDSRCEIYDISHMPDDRIKGEILLQVQLLLLKYVFKAELTEKLPEILRLFGTLLRKQKATEYLEVVLRYLVSSVDSAKTEELKTQVENAIENGGSVMPTIAEKWIREGVEKGMIEAAERMIRKDLTNADIRDITGLSIRKIEEIRKNLGKTPS